MNSFEKTQKYLTRLDLYDKDMYGIYIVDAEPLIGFKKVRCVCKNNKQYPVIADLEIPLGARIVKPFVPYDNGRLNSIYRTDRAIVKNIVIIDDGIKVPVCSIWTDCTFYSLNYNTYKYTVGLEHKPSKPLDEDLEHVSTSGIHFYLDAWSAIRHPYEPAYL